MVGILDKAIREEIELFERIGSQTLAKIKSSKEGKKYGKQQ